MTSRGEIPVEAVGGGGLAVDDIAKTTTITLWGEIDIDSESDLEKLRMAAVAEPYNVIIDTTAVTFLDSRAIVFLAKLIRTLAPRRVKVPDPPSGVAYLLEMTRIDTLLDITRS